MKTLLSSVILAIVSFGFFSFSATKNTVSIETALQEKKIALTILPTGAYSGNSINLRVKNLTSSILHLELPAGTIFVPDAQEEQTLITTSGEMLVLGQNAEKTLAVNAYCTEENDHCPAASSTFKMARSENASLLRLVKFMDSLKITDENAIQNSIWCMTDHESVANIYSEDTGTASVLRKFLCAATGQKDTWYSTRGDIRVNEERQIVRVPKEIEGELTFSSEVQVELQGVIKDSTGKIVFTSPNKMHAGPGEITFDFHLRIEGWKPGNYSVVYTGNGKELLVQPFTI